MGGWKMGGGESVTLARPFSTLIAVAMFPIIGPCR